MMNRREFFRTAAGVCALPLVALLPKSEVEPEAPIEEKIDYDAIADYILCRPLSLNITNKNALVDSTCSHIKIGYDII